MAYDVIQAKPLQREILLLREIVCVEGNASVSFIAKDRIKTACFYVQPSTT